MGAWTGWVSAWWTRRPSRLTAGAPPDPHRDASWFHRRWIATDQWLNVHLFNGLPDETISSHAGRLVRDGNPPWWARVVCWVLERVDPGHCRDSIGR